MYTLTRAAHVRPSVDASPSDMDILVNERSERENFGSNLVNSSLESNTDNESCYDSQDESLTMRLSSSSTTSTSSIVLRKRQPKITGEFRGCSTPFWSVELDGSQGQASFHFDRRYKVFSHSFPFIPCLFSVLRRKLRVFFFYVSGLFCNQTETILFFKIICRVENII